MLRLDVCNLVCFFERSNHIMFPSKSPCGCCTLQLKILSTRCCFLLALQRSSVAPHLKTNTWVPKRGTPIFLGHSHCQIGFEWHLVWLEHNYLILYFCFRKKYSIVNNSVVCCPIKIILWVLKSFSQSQNKKIFDFKLTDIMSRSVTL